MYRHPWFACARALIAWLLCLACQVTAARPAMAGQPFETDDPEPVACHHVEVDLQYSRQGPAPSTAPSIEVDYGPTQNVELSVAAQPAETDVGSAIRFVTETKSRPQIGFLPEIFFKRDGGSEFFLPLWMQKSVGKFTIFGGSGISPSYVSSGVAVQYHAGQKSAYGAEFVTDNPRTPGLQVLPRFNLGYTDQLDEGHAVMISGGRNFGPDARYSLYLAYQVILAPKGHASNCEQ